MTDTFEWSGNDSVVLQEQPATAVYVNDDGDIVIRQRDIFGDEDQFVYVRPENVGTLVDAMLAAVNQEGRPNHLLLLPAPKDKTAAERMRRYRARQRDGVASVTEMTATPARPLRWKADDELNGYADQRNDEEPAHP